MKFFVYGTLQDYSIMKELKLEPTSISPGLLKGVELYSIRDWYPAIKGGDNEVHGSIIEFKYVGNALSHLSNQDAVMMVLNQYEGVHGNPPLYHLAKLADDFYMYVGNTEHPLMKEYMTAENVVPGGDWIEYKKAVEAFNKG